MKSHPVYPWLTWPILAAIIVVTSISEFRFIAFLAPAVMGALGAFWKVKYSHPLGQKSQDYFLWLKTTPWRPGMRLPNGSLGITPVDGIFLLLLLTPPWAMWFSGFIPHEFAILFSGISLNVYLGVLVGKLTYSISYLGKRWQGYILVLLLVLLFYGFCISFSKMDVFWIGGTIGLSFTIYALALWATYRMLDGYPWQDSQDPATGKIRFTALEWKYNDASRNKSSLGVTMAGLNPRQIWHAASWIDALGTSAVTTLFSLPFTIFADRGSGTFFWGIIVFIAYSHRLGTYMQTRHPAKMPFADRAFRNLPRDTRPGMGSISLTLMFIGSALGIYYLPASLSPVITFLYCLTLFFWPPDLKRWETMGAWQLSKPDHTMEEPKSVDIFDLVTGNRD